jgi:hypothetical protein
MRIYKLHTNKGVRYVRSTDARLRAAMTAYINDKRAKGHSLASIVYCWTPLTIGSV